MVTKRVVKLLCRERFLDIRHHVHEGHENFGREWVLHFRVNKPHADYSYKRSYHYSNNPNVPRAVRWIVKNQRTRNYPYYDHINEETIYSDPEYTTYDPRPQNNVTVHMFAHFDFQSNETFEFDSCATIQHHLSLVAESSFTNVRLQLAASIHRFDCPVHHRQCDSDHRNSA